MFKIPSKFPVPMVLVSLALAAFGAWSLQSEDSCCKPGAKCCYPGSPCCAGHQHAERHD